MLSYIEIVGIVGGSLLIIKVIIHALLVWAIDKKFPTTDNYTELDFLVPLMNDVPAKFKLTKKIINVIYIVAITCILIFLTGKLFF